MRLALRLARRGRGSTSPNPMVGAVIVRDGRIIGRGYHRRCGDWHAEINALKSAREDTAGATIYINLEPCCHYGRTPPCVDALIRAGISRVVTGMLDPNPLVNGKSLELLRQRGIETSSGVLEEECRALNAAHIKYINTGLPLVTVKFAQTLDGRLAAAGGDSRGLSSAESLKFAHRLRSESDAVMVGSGTVLADDPRLTVRLVRGKNPVRVVLDSRLRLPAGARIFQEQAAAPTVVATTSGADGSKADELRAMGVEVLTVKEDRGGIDLRELLALLGQRHIASLLVEGGAGVITSLLSRGLADRVIAVIVPKILGKGIATVGELDITRVSRALPLTFTRTYRLGADLIAEASIQPPEG